MDELGILDDPGFTVLPPAPEETGGLAWIRRHVPRFSEGETHARRRALTEAELRRLAPADLAAAARAETRATTDQDSLGRTVPVRVLGRALGVEQPEDLEALAAAVPIAAAGYLTGAPSEPALEAAVTTLRRILGPGTDEAVAARIGLLLQAYEATATLVETALALGVNAREALRLKPPVAALRRVTPGGEIIQVDITAAPFSSGRRPCPGQAQAMAIVTGIIVEA